MRHLRKQDDSAAYAPSSKTNTSAVQDTQFNESVEAPSITRVGSYTKPYMPNFRSQPSKGQRAVGNHQRNTSAKSRTSLPSSLDATGQALRTKARSAHEDDQVAPGSNTIRRVRSTEELPLRSGFTWLTRDPSLVDFEQLRAPMSLNDRIEGNVKQIVLLATPSLASLVGDRDVQKDVLRALPFIGGRIASVNFVSAVVDELPPRPTSDSDLRTASHMTGTDGVAILISSAFSSDSFVEAPLSESRPDDQVDTLSFTANSSSYRTGPIHGNKMRGVTLPVANTIFVNGRRTTLLTDSWSVARQADGSLDMVHEDCKPLSSFDIALDCPVSDFSYGSRAPLRQLTRPRQVVSAMGNVLAQIKVEDEVVPASSELERTVHEYVKSNPDSTVHGPLLVYALIRAGADELSTSSTELKSRLMKHIWRGAQLFKVSGGGGGWGTRQGILSLEPAVDFKPSQTAALIDSIDLDNGENLVEKLGAQTIVPQGSTVEFFVHALRDAPTGTQFIGMKFKGGIDAQHEEALVDGEVKQLTILGVRSDPTNMPEGPTGTKGPEEGVTFVPGLFGMLSYGGAALYSSSQLQAQSGGQAESGSLNRTRIDVPGATFMLRGRLPKPR